MLLGCQGSISVFLYLNFFLYFESKPHFHQRSAKEYSGSLKTLLCPVQFSRSVTSDSLQPMDCSMPGFSVHHQLPDPSQTHVHWVVMPSNHLILCRPLLLPPSIFPSISVFFNESVFCIRWPKYWSFSFSISPSNEYSDTRLVRLEWRLTVVRKIMTLKCC